MAPNHQHKASKASFTKLKGAVNYESWVCNMTAALQTAELWSLITDQRKQSPFYITPPEATLEDKDHTWKQSKAIIAHEEKKRAAVRQIHLMCINEIQQEITSTKLINDLFQFEASNSDSGIKHWTSNDLWIWFRTFYTLKRWSVKWNVYNSFNKFELKNLNEGELINWGSKCFHLCQQIEKQKLTALNIDKMIMLNCLPAQLNTFKAIKQEKSYKNSTLPSIMNLINQIKKHACCINQENIVNFHKTKSRDNAQSKSNNNCHKFRNQNIPKCDDCSAKHSMKRYFYIHSELASEGWQSNKKVEEKVIKKKMTDKNKEMIKIRKRKTNSSLMLLWFIIIMLSALLWTWMPYLKLLKESQTWCHLLKH